MSQFVGDLVVKLTLDSADSLWELVEPLSFQSDFAVQTFTAPAGTKTDFMSVPRIAGVYDVLGNRCIRAGTVHDWLYQSHVVDRETADNILREMCLVDGMNQYEADGCYLAVRLGGESHW